MILIHDCDLPKKKKKKTTRRKWNIISCHIIYTVHESKGWCKKLTKSAITLYLDGAKCCGWIKSRKTTILEYEKSRKFKVIVFIIACLW
jgi:hypothetical protein